MISGQITNIQPDGSFQGSHGMLYCWVMTVQDANGQQHTAGIRSKTQSYPLGVGSPINVDLSQTDRGPLFKKINPQQQQPMQYQAPVQNMSAPQPMQQAQPPVQDEVVLGQVRMHVTCAAIKSGRLECFNPDDVLRYTEFIMTGKWPVGVNAPQNVSAQANPTQEQRDQGCTDPNEFQNPSF